MTAILAISKRDRIEVLTDGAWCDQHGFVVALHSKQSFRVIPECVITSSGTRNGFFWFAKTLHARCTNLDSAVDGVGAMWRDYEAERDPLGCHLVLAGWSESRRRMELRQSMDETVSGDLEVFASGPCDEAGELSREYADRFRDRAEDFDAVRHGVPFMERMRSYNRAFDGALAPAVGGFVQHTTLRRDYATTAIIHRWPDQIGERIGEGRRH